MKVGLPQGLMYYQYKPFFHTFFEELGAEILPSPNTNKQILNAGIKSCTSEACLPIKVFHGHVDSLKNKCDLLVIPRIMQVYGNEYICPHLCGISDMISNSIRDLPMITNLPIYFNSQKKLHHWAKETGSTITKDRTTIKNAFYHALTKQLNAQVLNPQDDLKHKILLLGHSYNIYDPFINRNLFQKLHALDIGVYTPNDFGEELLKEYVQHFDKKPFWYFFRQAYGSASFLVKGKKIEGIIYLSCFGCGMDAMISEVIKEDMPEIPFLSLKMDEHTSDAGIDTRIEAFSDMLKRKLEVIY